VDLVRGPDTVIERLHEQRDARQIGAGQVDGAERPAQRAQPGIEDGADRGRTMPWPQ
jgi:hypothetical protein